MPGQGSLAEGEAAGCPAEDIMVPALCERHRFGPIRAVRQHG